jgi:gentisate 1,2-dioxygenase
MSRLTRLALALVLTVNAIAASKDSGQTTLKDLQPAGVTDKKHKNQQYDLLFVTTSGKDYTCRTGEKTKLKVTDFVVGSDLAYVVNGNKAKLKSSSGKQVDCTIVRVANAAAAMK